MIMDCIECKGKLQIKKSYPQVEGDNSHDTPTVLYEVQEIACLNDKCKEFGIAKDTIRHKRELEV